MDNGVSLQPEKWVEHHGDYLFRYALARLRNRAAAEDAVQESFMAALRAQDRFSGKYSERSWLMGILKHKVIDYFRKTSRETPLVDADGNDLTDSLLFKLAGVPTTHPPRWKFNPRKVFEQKEFWQVFSGCLGRLNPRLHAAFVLKELEGEATEEICKELGVTANNLWVMLHRAREQLKTCLEENWLKLNRAS